jgi:hypothetical protein
MTTPLQTKNDSIIAKYPTYVVGTSENLGGIDLAPFGLETTWKIDPTRLQSATFLDLLQRLDGLTFGPEGMPMDKWVFYNCAELPGFIYGFATPASDLNEEERALFQVPEGYEGPVPISMYIAIPMLEEGAWFGHNLASLNRVLPARGLSSLGTITKALALKAYGVEHFFGATQWDSRALYIHTKFGPLDLITAYTPAHSIPLTLTYAFDVKDDGLRAVLGDPGYNIEFPQADIYLDADDEVSIRQLQEDIEFGAKVQLVGAPSLQGDNTIHRLRRLGES